MGFGKLVYGIDFGTTNSTIAVIKNGKIEKIKIDSESANPTVMRSVIYVSPKMQFLFGKSAIDAYLVDVAQGKGSAKKNIFTGRYITVVGSRGKEEVVPEIIEVEESLGGRLFQSLKTALTNNSIESINIFGKFYLLEELVGMFLREMKVRADKILGQDIKDVVIGRPIEYVGKNNKLALIRMEKALQYAGFENFKFEYEPVGAALDYGINIKDKQTVLIFDFGGGTLDISIFKLPEKEILANVGLPIGGDYFNSKIFMKKIAKYFGSKSVYGLHRLRLPSYIFDNLQTWYQISLLKTDYFMNSINEFKFLNSDPKTIDSLESLIKNNLGFSVYEEIERVKKNLSERDSGFYRFIAQNINIKELILRSVFEDLIEEDLMSIESKLNEALRLAGSSTKDITFVVTTGGSSLIPVVKSKLKKIFGEEKIIKSDVFTSVASGLALIASKSFYNKVGRSI